MIIKRHTPTKRGVILVIDDEPDICCLFEQILGEEGYTVLSAHNGLEGIARHAESNADVIILDLKMPKMDGVETLKRIRKTDPEVMVIILTGYGSAETIRDVLDLNVYEYISKPFENETVRRVVGEALTERNCKLRNADCGLQKGGCGELRIAERRGKKT